MTFEEQNAKSRSQVFTALELSAIALDLSDKLSKEPSGTDWFKVVDELKEEWYYEVSFTHLIKGEPDLMVFLREQIMISRGIFL